MNQFRKKKKKIKIRETTITKTIITVEDCLLDKHRVEFILLFSLTNEPHLKKKIKKNERRKRTTERREEKNVPMPFFEPFLPSKLCVVERSTINL